jgi:hypothetical protein
VPGNPGAPPGRSRARRRGGVWLVAFLTVLLLGARVSHLHAQVPDPEAAPADTAVVVIPPEEVSGDTIPAELRAAAASEATLPEMPPMPRIDARGWAPGRWAWNREELVRLPGLTLLEFLETLPGFVTFRAGGFGRPVGLTALAGGGGRVRVLIDGYEIDPFGAGSFEIESLSLLDLESVRVERTAAGIRVDVHTFRLPDPEPYSEVELGTGVFQTRVLRALFARGFGEQVVATGAFDLATTGGIGIREQYRHSNGVFRVSATPFEATGVQLEVRRTALDRAGTLFPREGNRSDLIVRLRHQLGERLSVEALGGRSVDEESFADIGVDRLRTLQAGLRGGYQGEIASAEGAVRGRRSPTGFNTAPALDMEGRAALEPFPALRLEASTRFSGDGGASALSAAATASLSPISPLSVFGSVHLGSTFAPRLFPAVADEENVPRRGAELLLVDAGGWRAGAEWRGGRGTLGLAAFQTAASPLLPFGLPFDVTAPPEEAGSVEGLEASLLLRVPGTRDLMRLEGWHSLLLGDRRPYAPADIGRAAVVLQGLFFEGQLEPILRVVGVRRGAADLFATAVQPAPQAPASHRLDLSLRIRIIDVQAFLHWENVLADITAIDFPGSPPGQPRIVYGANWRFRN